jgi:hypothetical protein
MTVSELGTGWSSDLHPVLTHGAGVSTADIRANGSLLSLRSADLGWIGPVDGLVPSTAPQGSPQSPTGPRARGGSDYLSVERRALEDAFQHACPARLINRLDFLRPVWTQDRLALLCAAPKNGLLDAPHLRVSHRHPEGEWLLWPGSPGNPRAQSAAPSKEVPPGPLSETAEVYWSPKGSGTPHVALVAPNQVILIRRAAEGVALEVTPQLGRSLQDWREALGLDYLECLLVPHADRWSVLDIRPNPFYGEIVAARHPLALQSLLDALLADTGADGAGALS